MSQATEFAQFDHFIPVSTSYLIESLADAGLSDQQVEVMRQLRQVMETRFAQRLRRLKSLYLPHNPDNELLLNGESTDAEACLGEIRKLLLAANFIELDRAQIEYALEKTSPYGVRIAIDFDAFAQVALFYRGKYSRSVEVRDWRKAFLKTRTQQMISYRRLFLVLRFHDQQNKPGLHLKLFKDILRPDLEMLFPDSRVQIKLFDKIKLLVTGGGGAAGGLFATIGKVAAAVNPWTIVVALAGFVMLLWRQVAKVFAQKTRYMMTLAQNLYFHNLDNNLGAVTRLVDMAQQEEIKEILLAYALLCQAPVGTGDGLDDRCEQWLQQQFDQVVDFDISDALDKLRGLELIEESETAIGVKPAAEISAALRARWLEYFA
jgi:hypothetical protein